MFTEKFQTMEDTSIQSKKIETDFYKILNEKQLFNKSLVLKTLTLACSISSNVGFLCPFFGPDCILFSRRFIHCVAKWFIGTWKQDC